MVEPIFQSSILVVTEVDKVGAEPPIQVTGTLDQVIVFAPAVICNDKLAPVVHVPAVGVDEPLNVQV